MINYLAIKYKYYKALLRALHVIKRVNFAKSAHQTRSFQSKRTLFNRNTAVLTAI